MTIQEAKKNILENYRERSRTGTTLDMELFMRNTLEQFERVVKKEGKKILETLAQDLSNSTIDGRLTRTQETFNNTMFQVITKIKSLIKFHYEQR